MQIPDHRFFITLPTGRIFDFTAPEMAEFHPDDFLECLSRVCRYNGAVPWTVLQHLAAGVTFLQQAGAPERLVAAFAAHDVVEAYVGDMTAPLKRLCPDYQKIEDRAQDALYRALGLSDWQHHPTIRLVDLLLLHAETQHFGRKVPAGVLPDPWKGYWAGVHDYKGADSAWRPDARTSWRMRDGEWARARVLLDVRQCVAAMDGQVEVCRFTVESALRRSPRQPETNGAWVVPAEGA